jgi:hypothetical protein
MKVLEIVAKGALKRINETRPASRKLTLPPYGELLDAICEHLIDLGEQDDDLDPKEEGADGVGFAGVEYELVSIFEEAEFEFRKADKNRKRIKKKAAKASRNSSKQKQIK